MDDRGHVDRGCRLRDRTFSIHSADFRAFQRALVIAAGACGRRRHRAIDRPLAVLGEISRAPPGTTSLAGAGVFGGGRRGFRRGIRARLFLGRGMAYARWLWVISSDLVCDGVDGLLARAAVSLRSASRMGHAQFLAGICGRDVAKRIAAADGRRAIKLSRGLHHRCVVMLDSEPAGCGVVATETRATRVIARLACGRAWR